MSSLLRWGVAGAGKISSDFVTACQSEKPQIHEFVAVASKNQANAKAFGDKFGIARSYGSYEELAKDAQVQVVYIGNLNNEHYATAKLFLQHGKHVLLEKPLTLNAKYTEALFKLAKKQNLFFMEALWSRFLPAYVFLSEQIKSGVIGNVVHANAEFGVPISSVDRVAKKEQGGGTILDLGVYTINLIQTAFDNEVPSKIAAVGHLNPNGVDVNVSAALNYSNGRSATFSTHSSVLLSNEARITGTKGYIELPSMFHCADRVIVNGVEHSFAMPEANGIFNFHNSSGLRFQAREVRQALLESRLESDRMPPKHSIIIANIEDEIRKQVGVDFDVDHVDNF